MGKREPDAETGELSRSLTGLLRERYEREGAWRAIADDIGETANTVQQWVNERGVPPHKLGAAARAVGLQLELGPREDGGEIGERAEEGVRRLRHAAARLDESQLDHLALIATRLADGSLPRSLIEGLAQLLDAAPHHVRPGAQQDQ